MVNKRPDSRTTTINSRTYTLGAYEVRLVEVEEDKRPAPPAGLTVENMVGIP